MIYIGADHGGFPLKEKVKTWLKEWKLPFEDLGAKKLDPEDDYPEFAFLVAQMVGQGDVAGHPWEKRDKGILLCRSAAGVIIAANKVKGVRAVAAFDATQAKHSRQHNDANVLGISGDFLDEKKAKEIIKTWLSTEFSKEQRHQRRINQISDFEYQQGGGCCGGGGNGGCSCD